jgi:ferredoxin-NADP reductase
VAAGDELDVLPPGGSFVLDEADHDVIGFAAGSGITPVLSIVRSVLATSDRHVRLLYANRDRDSTIFRHTIDALVAAHPDRLVVEHHLDDERGFVDGGTVTSFIGEWRNGEVFICGPTPFMNVVEATLTWNGIKRERVHVERFTPAQPEEPAGDPDDIEVVVTMGGKTVTAAHRQNATILQAARSAGLRAPSSCETGSCATCMARVVEGQAQMRNNEALTADEVADGWVLTCQAVPLTPVVKVVYE